MSREEEIKKADVIGKIIGYNICSFNPSTKLFSVKTQDAIYNIANDVCKWKEQQMIEKACEWLEENLWAGLANPKQRPQFINDFKKAMMEE